jgi:hypothetical protein
MTDQSLPAANAARPRYATIDRTVGNTPLVRLQRIPGATSGVIRRGPSRTS